MTGYSMGRISGRPARRVSAGVAAIAGLLLVAGCAGGSPGAAMPDGEPINVASMLPLGQAAGDFSVSEAGLKAAVRGINERGGIQGRPLVLSTCNTLLDPNQEAACARTAVDDGAVAMIAPFNVVNAEIPDILEQGQLASINPPQQYPQDFTNPINFVMTADAFAHAGCGGLVSKATGERRVAAITLDFPGAETAGDMAGQAAVAAGGEYVGSVAVPLNVTDMAPVVQRLADMNPDIVYLAAQPETIPQLLSTARAQGHDWTFCFGQLVQQSFLAPLGDLADNFYMVSSLPPIATAEGNALVEEYKTELTAEAGAGAVDPSKNPDQGFGAWLSVKLFEQVANTIDGPIDRATFLSAINGATVTFDGILPPISFATPNPDPAFSRVVNDELLLVKWNPSSGAFELVDGVGRTSAAGLLKG